MNRKERRAAVSQANVKFTAHVSLYKQDTAVVKDWCEKNGTNFSAYLRGIIHEEAESIASEAGAK